MPRRSLEIERSSSTARDQVKPVAPGWRCSFDEGVSSAFIPWPEGFTRGGNLGYPVEGRASKPSTAEGRPDHIEPRSSERQCAAAARPLMLDHVERLIDAVNWIGYPSASETASAGLRSFEICLECRAHLDAGPVQQHPCIRLLEPESVAHLLRGAALNVTENQHQPLVLGQRLDRAL